MKDLVEFALKNSECNVNLDFLLYETWQVKQGLQYIAGIHQYDEHFSLLSESRNKEDLVLEIHTISQHKYNTYEHNQIVEAFKNRLNQLEDLWSKENHKEHNAPEYFIVWARAKAEPVYWSTDAMQKLSQRCPKAVVERFYADPDQFSIRKNLETIRNDEIVRVINDLSLDRFAMSDECKHKVKDECLKLTQAPTYFTKDTFKKAWQSCLNKNIVYKVKK